MRKLLFIIFIMLGFCFPSKAQTTYFYVATAVDSTGTESAFSNEVSAVPTANHVNVNLTWIASTSTVSGYNVYRSKTSGTGYVKINSALITTLSYVDTFPFPTPPTNLKATIP